MQTEIHTAHTLVAITGAAGGLGRSFAVECASRGWDLLLIDVNETGLETLAEGIRRTSAVEVLTHPCDLTDMAAREALFARMRAESLRFWCLINVAGVDYEGPFFERTGQQIRTIVRLNIEATLEMTHTLLQYRDPFTAFRVINVASLAAFYPMPVKATYAASKRFLLDFSLALREEMRPMGASVTVLCPAGMPTNPECERGIEAQGWMGHITTLDTGRVANETINAALAGRAVVIPGWVNRGMRLAGALLPARWIARLIGSRWQSTHRRREQLAQPAALADSSRSAG